MLHSLLQKIKRIESQYWVILFFFLFLQRMDALVCPPLLELGYSYIVSWWIYMSVLVLIFAYTHFNILADQDLHQSRWYFYFVLMLYVGGLLDLFYMVERPAPAIWVDTNYIWTWNIFYILFNYPWTIKEQVIWWILWSLIILVVYIYMRRNYRIYVIKEMK